MAKIFVLLAWLALGLLAQAEELRLVQFSDIHAGGKFFSSDHFLPAVSEGLQLQPQAVLLSGDHCDNSHDLETFPTRYRQALLTWKQALAGYAGPVLFTLGNDDFRHNYQSRPEDLQDAYQAGLEIWGQAYYLDRLGNGVAPSRPGGFGWISFNSQVFALYNQTPEAEEQARQTLDWLEQQLKAEPGPVVLLCHIPPAWDLYNHKPGWQVQWLRRFLALLQGHSGQVVVLCGHYHRNHVQGLRRRSPVPVLTTGALATKYGYQPNWREYRWDIVAGKAIERIDYLIHYPLRPDWQHYYRLVPRALERFRLQLRQPAFVEDYLRDVYGHWNQWTEVAEGKGIRAAVWEEFWLEDGLDRAGSE